MKTYCHSLAGCNPTPLASYLKALGILRIVAEQFDPACRGWWQNEQFHLMTTKTKEELEQFFLERYEPTPVFNPWGGRSGFYKESSEKTARLALQQIENSTSINLRKFRSAISDLRAIIALFGDTKPTTKEQSNALVRTIRRKLRGSAIDWLDTVLVDLEDRFQGPPIFGTGGNEGSGSYTAAYYSALLNCFGPSPSRINLLSVLWEEYFSEKRAWNGTFSVPKSSNNKGAKTESIAAPFRQLMPEGKGEAWDLVFAFEGAMMLQSGVVRRSSGSRSKYLSSPFYFAPLGAGSSASSEFDEYVMNKGAKNAGRGEQWLPLWSRPSSFNEVKKLFRDSRCSFEKATAERPLNAAFAIAMRGTEAGISAFVRYAYLQRDNQTLHLAVPLGRIYINEARSVRFALPVVEWAEKLRKLARSKTATGSLVIAHRNLSSALFAAITLESNPYRWQAVLQACVDIECLQRNGIAIDAGPIPSLSPGWINAIGNDVEVRLALALASAAAGYTNKGWQIDSVRGHWLPLKPGPFARYNTSDKRLITDPRVVMTGRNFVGDCAAVVERRLIEAERHSKRNLPLVAYPRCGVLLGDVAQFIAGTVDDQKIYSLGRALMALKWHTLRPENLQELMVNRNARSPGSVDGSMPVPDEAWLMLRLVHLPRSLRDGKTIPVEPSVVRLLQSNSAYRAIEIAARRLRSAGIRPPLYNGDADEYTASRWAAALVFPLTPGSIQQAAELVDPALKGNVNVQS